jgi:tetratricopeptide (TPR) repeat protein
MLDEAIRRDPVLADARTARAWLALQVWARDFTADGAGLLAEMDADSLRAVALDERSTSAWNMRGWALVAQSRFDAAMAAADRVQDLDPTSGFFLRGNILSNTGRASEVLQLVAAREAMLGRSDPSFLKMACEAHLNLGEFEQAIAKCERANISDNGPDLYMNLAAAYGQTGDIAKATKAKDEVMRALPTFTISRFVARISSAPAWIEQQQRYVVPGWRKAGLPE